MGNKLFRTKTDKRKTSLSDEQVYQIKNKIKAINYKRLLIFSILTSILEIALIIFHDFPVLLNENDDKSVSNMYFVLHLLILLVSLIVLSLLQIYRNRPDSRVYDFIAEITVLAGITLMAAVGALDLYSIGSVTSYISISVVVAIVILVEPPKNYIVYSIPHILFLLLAYHMHGDQRLTKDTMVNSTLFFLCILLVSKVLYETQEEQIASNIVLEETNKKLEYLSNYDFLTNIYNRRHFEDLVISNVAKQHYAGKTVALGVIDIDFFKSVNDNYGHKAGDMVIQEVAKKILHSLNKDDLAARWGGEEFMILLAGRNVEVSHNIANEIRESVENMIVNIEGNTICVTVSLGLTEFTGDTEKDFFEGFKKADEALYLAKENGRNRIEWLG